MAIVRIGNTPDLLVGTGANGALEAKTAEAAREALGAQRALSVESFLGAADTELFSAGNLRGYKFGNVVVMSIEHKSAEKVSSWLDVGTVPIGYYPVVRTFFCAAHGTLALQMFIDKTGIIQANGTSTAGNWIYGQVVYMTA